MLLHADARALPIAADTVQCVVTSPPYWGLRDYGLSPSVWDADVGCAHEWTGSIRHGMSGGMNREHAKTHGTDNFQAFPAHVQHVCGNCDAWRGTLGLEPTPEMYVEHMIEVFREVRRVLRADGTLWLNLGDCYTSGNSGQRVRNSKGGFSNTDGLRTQANTLANPGRPACGEKPKDLVGIPWRVAFALQADGWYLRADIIWAKPNPMPESVTDRPTKAHEYMFLLAKSERYFYDAEAIQEPSVNTWNAARSMLAANGIKNVALNKMGQRITAGADTFHRDEERTGRNRRSVWTIGAQPYPEAHFATFPEALVAPCILAGTKPGDIVLDPFSGTGTVGAVAERFGRRWLGVEIQPAYLDLARRRTAQKGLGL